MISSTDVETQGYLWDLGVVLEALSKPPSEPFCETFLKHQMVFLLAIASAERGSELQHPPNTYSSKTKGSGITVNFCPEFMYKNQRPTQTNDPWFVQEVRTGKPEFSAPNCPVRALMYYNT